MPTICNKVLRYTINEQGEVCSCVHLRTGDEYIRQPFPLWKLICSEGERQEIPVFPAGQTAVSSLSPNGAAMTLRYGSLLSDDRELAIGLSLHFALDAQGLCVTAEVENRDSVSVCELQLTAVAGVRSLGGDPAAETLTWPLDLGRQVKNPAFSDLSVYAGFRKYERHDQFHTDMDGLYPGRLGMQWYDLYSEGQGLYVGMHNALHHTVCLHVERDVKRNLLSLGGIWYPMLQTGESWQSQPMAYYPHMGDWHAGAAIYRRWMESVGWQPPQQPEWVRNWKGWLRVILKQHHGELNWSYQDIPRLYDEAEAAGLDTLFLLGWERGGFARMWPDYLLDERMGGQKLLRDGINYVHSRGGKVVMFLSYLLIDRQSEFYKSGKGREATVKSIWGEEVPFAETYCGEGTYRKVGNPPMPMYFACPSSQLWQDKMLESTGYCLDLGADGVLFDLGGHPAYFCYDTSHGHDKPSHAYASKAERYGELHRFVRGRGADKIIMMEDNVDIFAQHMDIAQGGSTRPKPDFMLELYRYTFPECVVTNRECGQDEENYQVYAGYSFVYGLRFDMTIYRCCGSLSDIPDYAAYLLKVNTLREQFADCLLRGRFVDNEGFSIDNTAVVAKGYRSAQGRQAVALWNPTSQPQTVTIAAPTGGSLTVTVAPNAIDAVYPQ